jgi:hypothetical protein
MFCYRFRHPWRNRSDPCEEPTPRRALFEPAAALPYPECGLTLANVLVANAQAAFGARHLCLNLAATGADNDRSSALHLKWRLPTFPEGMLNHNQFVITDRHASAVGAGVQTQFAAGDV